MNPAYKAGVAMTVGGILTAVALRALFGRWLVGSKWGMLTAAFVAQCGAIMALIAFIRYSDEGGDLV